MWLTEALTHYLEHVGAHFALNNRSAAMDQLNDKYTHSALRQGNSFFSERCCHEDEMSLTCYILANPGFRHKTARSTIQSINIQRLVHQYS